MSARLRAAAVALLLWIGPAHAAHPADPPPLTNTRFDEDYRYLLIDEAIDRLPAQQRQVYLLSRHERLTYLEVATRMNISKETVKKYLQIATESIASYIRNRLLTSLLVVMHFFISK